MLRTRALSANTTRSLLFGFGRNPIRTNSGCQCGRAISTALPSASSNGDTTSVNRPPTPPQKVLPPYSTLLRGRRCLVTNCDSERENYLPCEVALALARCGASVLVHGENENVVSPLMERLCKIHSSQNHGVVVADLHQPEQASMDIVAATRRHFDGALDVLVHNAGIVDAPPRKLDEYPLEGFEAISRLNLSTPFALVQKMLPLMENGALLVLHV
eukprot:TRINITY_DN3651_c0_g1_i2.p1 TRINITY_DN3651_c0_g1~~TRINITY_DN3651_c0_g1_i2.p1  ORF type:complete len:216 (-),score=17.17 TRINITY_DN3651_c0_g1_i2:459-1106(-)